MTAIATASRTATPTASWTANEPAGRSIGVTTPEARPPVRRKLRPGQGGGRALRPQSRPDRPLAAPRLSAPIAVGSAACRVERADQILATPPVAIPKVWRITDRGIALVLATGLAIAAAAVVVVSLTALRVTGDSYQPTTRSAPQWP